MAEGGKKKGKRKSDNGESKEEEVREGELLLGMPTFEETGNGRLRCVETGHEVVSRDLIGGYSRSKGCRLALIDAALKIQKPPLNMFKQDPNSKSKIICKLTGDTVNKSEEHIWKHISGKKFQRKLDQKEVDMTSNGVKKDKAKKGKEVKLNEMNVEKQQSEVTDVPNSSPKADEMDETGSEESDFWVPPDGNRWDFDNGKDRWENSASETDEMDAEYETEAIDLPPRTKRSSDADDPLTFQARGKKSRMKI